MQERPLHSLLVPSVNPETKSRGEPRGSTGHIFRLSSGLELLLLLFLSPFGSSRCLVFLKHVDIAYCLTVWEDSIHPSNVQCPRQVW